MLYCACYGYVTYYLMEKGFSSSTVGVISAVFGIASTAFQPVVGQISDKLKKGWKLPLMCLLVAAILADVIMIFIHVKPAQGIFFGIMMAATGIMMPLINAICFTCTEDGKGIDFGVARGIGSLGYAVISVIIGYVCRLFGAVTIPVFSAILSLCLFALIILMPFYMTGTDASAIDTGSTANPSITTDPADRNRAGSGIVGLLRECPGYIIMWSAGLLMMTFHCMTNTYMLQIVGRAGGSSDALGITLGIAAVMELPVMFAFSWISRRLSPGKLFLLAGAAFTIKGILYLAAGSVWVIWISQLLQMLSFAVYVNASVLYASISVPAKYLGLSQSLMSITISAGTVIGSLVGGFLIDSFGVNMMLIMGVVTAVCGTILSVISVYSERKNNTQSAWRKNVS